MIFFWGLGLGLRGKGSVLWLVRGRGRSYRGKEDATMLNGVFKGGGVEGVA